jgi:hypothetical protein
MSLRFTDVGQVLGKSDKRRIAMRLRAVHLDVFAAGVQEASLPPARVVQHESPKCGALQLLVL